MKTLSQNIVDTVAAELKGARLNKFIESVDHINASLAAGGWQKGGHAKASKGFYQGTNISLKDMHGNDSNHVESSKSIFNVYMCFAYGSSSGNTSVELKRQLEIVNPETYKKFSKTFMHAWIDLCIEKSIAIEAMENSRPLPVITPIGLSPRVTTTFTEMNLDIDLPSIRMADIDFYLVPKINMKTGKTMIDYNGDTVMEKVYYVKWSDGIKHNRSRFAKNNACHACGKNIPSRRFVPVEAKDKKSNSIISLWLGCDCAKNVFGIKDKGISQDAI